MLTHILIPGGQSHIDWGNSSERFDFCYQDTKNKETIKVKCGLYKNLFEEQSNNTKPVLIYFHVNGGLDFSQIASFLEEGYEVVAFEFLGYGNTKIKNQPTVEMLVEQSEKVLEKVEEYLKNQNENYDRKRNIAFVGRSLGSIVATKLATRLEEQGSRCAAVVNIVRPHKHEYCYQNLSL